MTCVHPRLGIGIVSLIASFLHAVLLFQKNIPILLWGLTPRVFTNQTFSRFNTGISDYDERTRVGSATGPRILHVSPSSLSASFKLSNNSISKSILRMEYHMPENSYPTYNDFHNFKRNRWFEKFAQEFTWDLRLTKTVKTALHQYASGLYNSQINE
ncbi:hypothetical protein Bca52824_039785 [Brassica carinata]|uniref:Uncharacterized protein n=1 Tax=Brassica carinata TaxID=52824 RepID=A0A8X7UX79_BRACI|nr:hypothetical protein Bca52824_039785 [Brassica carinata]